MFQHVQPAPPDPILGLSEAFGRDPNPEKINLSVGVYKDPDGRTPILDTVKQAEHRLLQTEATKAYKPIAGDPAYALPVQKLMLGAGHPAIEAGRAVTAHTPGGTGALRIAGDYLRKLHPDATLWVSDPTWANHANVFKAAEVPLKTYPYYDPETHGLNFDAMLDALKQVPAGDAVLLHGACHNPTGVDPTPEQWAQIGETLAERGILPLVDFAYQGFGDGLEADATGLRTLTEKCPELIICSSFSKNFGLYNERVGALTLIADSPETADAVQSQIKTRIRSNYSNPPAHGGAIVTTILNDENLYAQWEREVADMRQRINTMRDLFVKTLADKGVNRDFSFIRDQRGMFSFSGLTKDQVETLREKHSIYIVGSGRINVAGMSEQTMPRLCDAIQDVL